MCGNLANSLGNIYCVGDEIFFDGTTWNRRNITLIPEQNMAPTPSAAQQEEYLNRLRTQIQTQTIQEIMQKMTEKCFKVNYSLSVLSLVSEPSSIKSNLIIHDKKKITLSESNLSLVRFALAKRVLTWTPASRLAL